MGRASYKVKMKARATTMSLLFLSLFLLFLLFSPTSPFSGLSFSRLLHGQRFLSMDSAVDVAGVFSSPEFTLDSVREALVRQEDTIVFCLIERARFPSNSRAYDDSYAKIAGFSGSLFRYFVKKSEALQAKVGRYKNPEEQPFFPENLPSSLVPPQSYPKILYPAAASININKMIWDFYLAKLLPLLVSEGDDGNYALTAARDLECLQALSRRIHYGKFVAEVKFKNSSGDYEPAIRAQDRAALMKLLTFENVEKMVVQRVKKKARMFGQEVSLNATGDSGKFKVDPSVVSRLFAEWVMPLTKLVQVEYLLRRLD